MPEFTVILPAAGQSTRFSGAGESKVLIDLAGRPVWSHSALRFLDRTDVTGLIVSVDPSRVDWFREHARQITNDDRLHVVAGGSTRAESVCNALHSEWCVSEFVAVHDAARPLISPDDIEAVFAEAMRTGAAIPGTPITSTVKRVNSALQIVETLDRESLIAAQTPQVFRRDWLVGAYQTVPGAERMTDESQLVANAGHTVVVVKGSPLNIKLTTPEDLEQAAAILRSQPR